VHSDEVPALINDVYGALVRVGAPVIAAPAREPAVPVKRSIQHDYIVCLEDGAKLKILTRYLARFGLTPEMGAAERLPDGSACICCPPVSPCEAVWSRNRLE
jgi:predicted transcriptional regulator